MCGPAGCPPPRAMMLRRADRVRCPFPCRELAGTRALLCLLRLMPSRSTVALPESSPELLHRSNQLPVPRVGHRGEQGVNSLQHRARGHGQGLSPRALSPAHTQYSLPLCEHP